MKPRSLHQLEWHLITQRLADLTSAPEARDKALNLSPTLDAEAIRHSWTQLEPLRDLIRAGYRPPRSSVEPVAPILKSARLGQTLDGEQLRLVHTALLSTRNSQSFCGDFAERCSTLRRFRGGLYPLPNLAAAIDRAIAPDGQLRDNASPEIARIRQATIHARSRIESSIRNLFTKDPDVTEYLQDDFFTVRADRYVIPVRLDGRGRVKGHIIDLSDSGQTLYIEPTSVQPLNEELLELNLAERLEILRIFRDLTTQIDRESSVIQANYDLLLELDLLTAKAALAAQWDAASVTLATEPTIDLLSARHPLLIDSLGANAVSSNIRLESSQQGLIISGPNAGGKTVILKTVGLIHAMARAGLLVTADPQSQLYLFSDLHLELGDAQDITANLSTFSGHLMGLKPILASAAHGHLVLLDELAVGTDPQTGASIAQAMLEHLASRGATILVSTHFDALKALSLTDPRFRNGSMEFSPKNRRPTFKLLLDVPGQSYGLETARVVGLPADLIARAEDLRGRSGSILDEAVNSMMAAREEAREAAADNRRKTLEAESEKARWTEERRLLDEARRKAGEKLAARYDTEIFRLREAFEESQNLWRRLVKEHRLESLETPLRDRLTQARAQGQEALSSMHRLAREAEQHGHLQDELPGRAAEFHELAAGASVYVIPLKQKGKVERLPQNPKDAIEIRLGMVTTRLPLSALRLTEPETNKQKLAHQKNTAARTKAVVPEIVLQQQGNTCDLRGMDVDSALDKAWAFIDSALMRREFSLVIIHGHGTDRLKLALREALKRQTLYPTLAYRAGNDKEGGDGVTIVALG